MAVSTSALSSVLSTLEAQGITTLGGHTQATAAAQNALEMIVSNANNPASVVEYATQALNDIGTANADATNYLVAIKVLASGNAYNPNQALALAGQAQAALLAKSSGLLGGIFGL